jgi:hypothetical protein
MSISSGAKVFFGGDKLSEYRIEIGVVSESKVVIRPEGGDA